MTFTMIFSIPGSDEFFWPSPFHSINLFVPD
jgi:hypothetical protein